MPFDSTPEPDTTVRPEVAICDRMLALLATEDRWCKDRMHKGLSMCAVAALRVACGMRGGESWKTPAGVMAYRIHQRVVGMTGVNLAILNDRRDVTHPDILALIRRVRASFE